MKRNFRGAALRLFGYAQSEPAQDFKGCKIIKMCHPDKSEWHTIDDSHFVLVATA
jgi:hypothetical protein